MNKILEILLILTVLAGLGLFVECQNPARAQVDDETALNLGRCMRAETDTYSADWSAMAWVLKKRAIQKGVTLNEMVLSYCAVFDRRSRRYYKPRSKDIRESIYENPLHGTAEQWKVIGRFVEAFLKGKIPDPCPEAEHFGNAGDVGNKALIEVCPELGKRGNKFYRVRR